LGDKTQGTVGCYTPLHNKCDNKCFFFASFRVVGNFLFPEHTPQHTPQHKPTHTETHIRNVPLIGTTHNTTYNTTHKQLTNVCTVFYLLSPTGSPARTPPQLRSDIRGPSSSLCLNFETGSTTRPSEKIDARSFSEDISHLNSEVTMQLAANNFLRKSSISLPVCRESEHEFAPV
jgi:hypothetical protein